MTAENGSVLKLGYKASAEQFGPTELLQFSRLAEQSGFDSVFISDHFQPWKHHGGHAPFSLAWLGALGALTSRITMGTSVMTPTFRYHPAVVAQAFATLGVMFPDRIVLGVGTGESLNEVPSTGMAWPEFKERFARLREAVTLMRRLWTEERVTFEGQYYRTKDATIYDRPATPVPIYIAAAGALIAKYAGRMGDGLICTSGKARELYTETILPKVLEGRGEAGSRAPDYARMIEVKVSFDTDMKRAMEDTRQWAVLALTPEEKISVHSPEEMERLADGLSAERAASRWIVSTDPDEHVERIGYYVDLGFDHLVFHAPGPIRSGSSGSMRSTFCLASVVASARRTECPRAHDLSRGHRLAGPALDQRGDDLVELVASALKLNGVTPRAGDVLVVAQKIVSKAEGRVVDLATIEPSAQAVALAADVDKDPRLVEVILSESVRVVRARRGVLIVEHRLGFIMANAGVDQSNVGPADGSHRVLLLPDNPDRSAETLRRGLAALTGIDIAVVINDSFGRPWRQGTVGVAIGVAGLPALIDLRGRPDLFGRRLEVSIIGFADEVAAAASLLMGQADEALPAVLVRGLRWPAPESTAASIVRPTNEDLFR